MTDTRTRKSRYQWRHTAFTAGLLAILLVVLGPPLAVAQDGSQAGGNAQASEAVIDQVSPSEATPRLTAPTNLPEDQLLQTILGKLQSVGPDLSTLTGSSPLLQEGQQAIIRQDGTGNAATVDQRNTSNLAIILQRGVLNETTVTQRGRSNAAGIVLDGSNNSLDVLQAGNGNRYLLGFQGDDLGRPGSRAVSQRGNNNLLVELGRTSMPFSIQQNGNGMRMMIRHSGGQ